MAKSKSDNKTAQINFKCSAELKRRLEILALLNRNKDMTELLVEMCNEYIKANEQSIKNIECLIAERPINKPMFAAQDNPSITSDNKGGDML